MQLSNKKSLRNNRKKYEKHSKYSKFKSSSQLLISDILLKFCKTKCRCETVMASAKTNADLRATIRWNTTTKRLNHFNILHETNTNKYNKIKNNNNNKRINTNHDRRRHQQPRSKSLMDIFKYLWVWTSLIYAVAASDLDKSERFLDKINEQSIAAVFNKVAYGSTTKRSIPDNAYIYTTLATPLLTTYKYSDGNQEWYRVDVKEPEILTGDEKIDNLEEDRDDNNNNNNNPVYNKDSYGLDLEKDHVLPTSAPAADILKNNNNKNYNNPNRYNNDKLRPEPPVPPLGERYNPAASPESVTEKELPRTSTGYSVLRNVRPTKSMFGKDIPSYVPPSRSFFTPPLPPEYLNPFADKPTLRGTNSDTYQNRRPIPPPSLMPKKDRIPFRPDLPPSVSDNPTNPAPNPNERITNFAPAPAPAPENPRNTDQQRKKTLNTPSQNVHLDRLGEFYGLNRLHNESNFEYEPMVLIPSISRILSGSNGRKEDLPDILLRTVTAAPPRNIPEATNRQKTRHDFPPGPVIPPEVDEETLDEISLNNQNVNQQAVASPTIPKNHDPPKSDEEAKPPDTTTIISDILNLPNVKVKPRPEVLNTTRAAASGHEIWSISWNVHIYLVVFLYVLLAVFSIVKLVRFERENHMFSKSYFLAVHLLLTTICVLRIFYLAYDPYNINKSFGIFTYDILHNLPLSLLATTFAILIVFLLKRTLTHLKVKTRPVFLVLFSLGHMFLCFCLNLAESFDLFTRASFWSLICRFVYILLCWSLGLSYVYLYKIIKNVLAKKSQNLSEMCSQNISYASHITIAIALLFTLLGFVQLYGLFFIKIDRFIIAQHWILWGWELSIRLLEISIITLLAIVVSLRMSQREKTNVGFPLFPCTTSDSSSDNIYPNNCNTNLNALNYSLRSQNQYRTQNQDIPTDVIERPNLIEKKSTLERTFPAITSNNQDLSDGERNFERFERPTWQGSQRFQPNFERDNFPVRNFERGEELSNSHLSNAQLSNAQLSNSHLSNAHLSAHSNLTNPHSNMSKPPSNPHSLTNDHSNLGSLRSDQFDTRGGSGRFTEPTSSNHSASGSARSSLKPYEKCRYYAKPKYDDMYNSSSGGTDDDPKLKRNPPEASRCDDDSSNLYSEPLDVSAGASSNNSDYERRYQELDRQDMERRSRSSWTNSGRRSTGRNRKSDRERAGRNHQAGVHTLPNQDSNASMLVDERGFLRFRQLGEEEVGSVSNVGAKPRKHRYHQNDHYSDA